MRRARKRAACVCHRGLWDLILTHMQILHGRPPRHHRAGPLTSLKLRHEGGGGAMGAGGRRHERAPPARLGWSVGARGRVCFLEVCVGIGFKRPGAPPPTPPPLLPLVERTAAAVGR